MGNGITELYLAGQRARLAGTAETKGGLEAARSHVSVHMRQVRRDMFTAGVCAHLMIC